MKTKTVDYKCPECGLQTQFKDIDMNNQKPCPECGCAMRNKNIVAHSIDGWCPL